VGQKGRGLGHVTYFSNFVTPNICGIVEGTKLKFSMQIDRKEYKTEENEKWVKMGRGLGNVTYFSNFGTP